MKKNLSLVLFKALFTVCRYFFWRPYRIEEGALYEGRPPPQLTLPPPPSLLSSPPVNIIPNCLL